MTGGFSGWYNHVDWSATGSWMQAWAGFSGASAVAWAAYKGSKTFSTWLLQKQTERRIEVGERVLTIVYRAGDTFAAIRSPGSTGGENAEAEAKLREAMPQFDNFSPAKRRGLVSGQIALSRIYDQADLWKAYFEVLPMVRAYFGKSFEEKFRSIWLQRAKIYAAAITYGDMDPQFNNQEQIEERRNNFEAIIWDGWAGAIGRPDDIKDAIDTLVNEAEALILPIIAGKNATGI